MEDSTKDMFSALMKDNANEFSGAFDSAIKSRIADKFLEKNHKISNSILQNDSVDKEVKEAYGRTSAKNYNFKSPMDAKKYYQAALKAGATRKGVTLKGKQVTIGDLPDADLEELLYFLAKDMKAVIKEETNNVSRILQEIILTEEPMKVLLNDDSSVKISLNDAKCLVAVHDNLHKDNQNKMRYSLTESKEEFNKIMNFSKNITVS
jgi:hypothetical protein